MLVKDKDILVDEPEKKDGETELKTQKPQRPHIKKENMRRAWGDAFDTYIRGITENYMTFRGRSSRLEFWGFAAAAGIVWFPLYFLGDYIEMPMLAYYYTLATLIPTAAVAARRLHDINKNAALYLTAGIILAASGFFIGFYGAAGLVAAWAFILVRLFSRETDLSDGFYGAPKENDEVYGDDNLPIIKKLRFIALALLAAWIAVSWARFDDWSRQAQQKATIDMIMEKVASEGEAARLAPQDIETAQKKMKDILRSLSGQRISEKDLAEQINNAVKAAAEAQK